MAFDRGKFKELVLYLAQRSTELGDDGFGLVKLNKLLYRADFEAFRLLGSSITGETYERQDFGPVAQDLPIVLDELAASGRLTWQRFPAGPRTRTAPRAEQAGEAASDVSAFTSDQLNVIEKALDELVTIGGKAVSDWSHEQSVGWNVARENGNVIEYHTALISAEPIPDDDLERAGQFVHERGWV